AGPVPLHRGDSPRRGGLTGRAAPGHPRSGRPRGASVRVSRIRPVSGGCQTCLLGGFVVRGCRPTCLDARPTESRVAPMLLMPLVIALGSPAIPTTGVDDEVVRARFDLDLVGRS